MVNRALCDRVDADAKERQERQVQAEENKKEKEAFRDWPKILKMRPDIPYRGTPLHSLALGLKVQVHRKQRVLRDGSIVNDHVICEKTYAGADPKFENCKVCATKVEGRPNNSFSAIAIIEYIHNYHGQVFKPEGSETAYPVNPERVVLVRYGRSSTNITALIEADRKGKFMHPDCVWVVAKTGVGKDTMYKEPQQVHKSMLTDEGEFVVPKEVLDKYNPKRFDDPVAFENFVAQRILNAFDEGVLWEVWEVEKPQMDATTSTAPEEPAKKAGEAKKALS